MRRNMRWVATHINQDGDRVMSFACQHRNTYGTREEAANQIAAVLQYAHHAVMYPSMEPREVECWQMKDGSIGDPKGVYFDE